MDFMEKVERQLDLPLAAKSQVMRELKSHYEDLKEELIGSGMSGSEAETEALKRLGEPADIAAQMSAVHNTASWKSALLAAAPWLIAVVVTFLRWAFVPFSLIQPLTLALGTVFAIGTLRELIRGRRPIWMATWFAVSMILAIDGIPALLVRHWGTTSSQSAYRLLVLSGAMWSILALAACWKSPKLRLCSIAAAFVTLLLTVIARPLLIDSGTNHGHLSVGVLGQLYYIDAAINLIFIIPFITKLLVGLGVFVRHAYGTAAQTSLFLLALYAVPGYIRLPYGPWSTGYIAFKLLGWIAFTLTIIAFTRTSSTRMKLSILVGGMLIGGLMVSFSHAFLLTTMKPRNTAPIIVTMVIMQLLPYMLVAVSPLVWDLWRKRRQRMEIA